MIWSWYLIQNSEELLSNVECSDPRRFMPLVNSCRRLEHLTLLPAFLMQLVDVSKLPKELTHLQFNERVEVMGKVPVLPNLECLCVSLSGRSHLEVWERSAFAFTPPSGAKHTTPTPSRSQKVRLPPCIPNYNKTIKFKLRPHVARLSPQIILLICSFNVWARMRMQ